MQKEKEEMALKISQQEQMLSQMKNIVIADQNCHCQELMDLLEMSQRRDQQAEEQVKSLIKIKNKHLEKEIN